MSSARKDYFEKIYLPWVNGAIQDRIEIENTYLGVHEFNPWVRGECRTADFTGTHPESIDKNKIHNRIHKELGEYLC